MNVALITGSSGLIGSEACRFFHQQGYSILGVDNNMRAYFFGDGASTAKVGEGLAAVLENYISMDVDIRNYSEMEKIFLEYSSDISVIVHTAAQPSHDWAANEPLTDFTVNANGTLNLLELTRKHCPEASFIFTSTNKVYGDRPNSLPLVELESRWEIRESHPYYLHGIDEEMSIDQSKHSLFGASKVAADILVQEYGKYFGMKTVAFRGGCLTGPSHQGTELHGFLAYLVQCAVHGRPYTVFGHRGKQVRDNIHSKDLINVFWHFCQNPRCGEVYNIGGSRHSNISMIEAIEEIERISGHSLEYSVSEQARIGDHIWYVSDVRKFRSHYPDFEYQYDATRILKEIIDATLVSA